MNEGVWGEGECVEERVEETRVVGESFVVRARARPVCGRKGKRAMRCYLYSAGSTGDTGGYVYGK